MKQPLLALALMSLAVAGVCRTATATENNALVSTGLMACALADEAKEPVQILVEFDESVPIVSVNESDHPADYTASHIRIRFTPEGPTLTIGRVTGRALLLDSSGTPVSSGRCEASRFI